MGFTQILLFLTATTAIASTAPVKEAQQVRHRRQVTLDSATIRNAVNQALVDCLFYVVKNNANAVEYNADTKEMCATDRCLIPMTVNDMNNLVKVLFSSGISTLNDVKICMKSGSDGGAITFYEKIEVDSTNTIGVGLAMNKQKEPVYGIEYKGVYDEASPNVGLSFNEKGELAIDTAVNKISIDGADLNITANVARDEAGNLAVGTGVLVEKDNVNAAANFSVDNEGKVDLASEVDIQVDMVKISPSLDVQRDKEGKVGVGVGLGTEIQGTADVDKVLNQLDVGVDSNGNVGVQDTARVQTEGLTVGGTAKVKYDKKTDGAKVGLGGMIGDAHIGAVFDTQSGVAEPWVDTAKLMEELKKQVLSVLDNQQINPQQGGDFNLPNLIPKIEQPKQINAPAAPTFG